LKVFWGLIFEGGILSESTSPHIQRALRQLRLKDALEDARSLIRSQPGLASSRSLQRLLHEHQDFWWEPIVGKRVTLRRRDASDAQFVRESWGDADFMRKFNRMARPLPQDEGALQQLLSRERATIPSESGAMHWMIDGSSGPIGFVSATGISMGHRRCEFLIGVIGHQVGPAPVEAAQLALDFLQRRLGMERLTAYFYPENAHAMRVACKFGFQIEGTLKGYVRDAHGIRSDE
jgi:RimJ/RimL family protein N-acetyltransferase